VTNSGLVGWDNAAKEAVAGAETVRVEDDVPAGAVMNTPWTWTDSGINAELSSTSSDGLHPAALQGLGRVCKLMDRFSSIPKGCRKLAGGNTPGTRNKKARTPEGCRKIGLRTRFQHPSGVRSVLDWVRRFHPRLISVNPPGSFAACGVRAQHPAQR